MVAQPVRCRRRVRSYSARTRAGRTTNWAIELGSPNVLVRNGWRRTTVKIGDVVVVQGSRARNGTPLGNARSIVLASTGQQLFAGSSEGNAR